MKPSLLITAAVCCTALFGCSARPSSGENSSPEVRENISPRPDDAHVTRVQYCFNGRYIVLSEGKYGISSEEGDVVLAPEYDSAEFLSVEVAIAGKGKSYILCDRDGRIIHTSPDRAWLEENFSILHENLIEEDRLYWDKAIEMFSDLSRRCSSLRQGKRVTAGELSALSVLTSDLESYLVSSRGKPTAEQVDRIEEISSEYPTASR